MEVPQTGVEAMKRAVADLWSQCVGTGDDFVAFYDHEGSIARVRQEGDAYRIAWVQEGDGDTRWLESEREFDNPREAAFVAFQGSLRGK